MKTPINRTDGFTLIEVLVAILILAVGLMGLSAMQLTSLKVNQGAYYRSQASILASDILDRMRANRDAFESGEYDSLDTSGSVPSAQGCISSTGCTRTQLASQDFYEWSAYFEDLEGLGNDYQPFIPGAVGTVEVDADNNATVTISWGQEGWGDDGSGKTVKEIQTQQFQVVVRI